MPGKEQPLQLEGEVIEALPNAMFRVAVEIAPGRRHLVLATLSGRMRRQRIRVIPGDRVELELTPYDLSRGRIVWRR